MKFFLLLAVCVAAASAVSYRDVLLQEYDLYKAQYGKSYETPLENSRRFEIFMEKKYEVAEHNLKYKNGEVTYEMEINEFSDWLPEEFDRMNGFNRELRERAEAGETVAFPEIEGELYEPAADDEDIPSSINWVDEGAVSPVKNQGACGSCYAFSAIGALESQQYLKNKTMVRLSEQQIVDCSGEYGNMGCIGGFATFTYDYIIGNGGVNTEFSYQYEARDGKCRYDKENNGATCSNYTMVTPNEEALKVAVAKIGPVSVAIHAMNSFMNYKNGVYYDPECKNYTLALNHAVLVVGYGTDFSTDQDYWLVKNSWGAAWGERGYVRMARNKNNHCGIATFALFPKL